MSLRLARASDCEIKSGASRAGQGAASPNFAPISLAVSMCRGKPGSLDERRSAPHRSIDSGHRVASADQWRGAPGLCPAGLGRPVGKRLVEALRTLRLLPTSNGPRVFGNAWPAYFHGWEDLLAQQEMEKDLREQLERARNRTRLLPSSIEIAHMETAIGWPGRYLLDCPSSSVSCRSPRSAERTPRYGFGECTPARAAGPARAALAP